LQEIRFFFLLRRVSPLRILTNMFIFTQSPGRECFLLTFALIPRYFFFAPFSPLRSKVLSLSIDSFGRPRIFWWLYQLSLVFFPGFRSLVASSCNSFESFFVSFVSFTSGLPDIICSVNFIRLFAVDKELFSRLGCSFPNLRLPHSLSFSPALPLLAF